MQPTPEGPIAILAGSGQLPALVADALARAGRDHRILAFRGFADAHLRDRADAVADLLDVQRATACLRDWKPAAVTLVGGVGRPRPTAVLGAFSAFRNRREIGELMARGDDQLLRGVVKLLEDQGHAVVGAHELAPGLLAGGGALGRVLPTEDDRRAAATGLALLGALSPFDVGQAVVVAGERVLAVEGPEGTDRMLRRVGRLGRGWRLRRAPSGGVLVKTAKRDQDLRVDMPAIGPRTVREAARAGLAGIAVGQGSTLVLDRDETVREADRLGLFVIGVPLPWAEAP